MENLFLITARGGSKGIPGKNIKPLNGKPLIYYSIDIARQFVEDSSICVSTDSSEIKTVVENYNLEVPFLRPSELASDQAGSYEVILHALEWYEKKGIQFKNVLLLQPTSPFRLSSHINAALKLYTGACDMVASVKKIKSNIFSTYYQENESGWLKKIFANNENSAQRQDSTPVYELNGSVYLMNVSSLKKMPPGEFKNVKKLLMEEVYSVDIDEPADWLWAEFLLKEKLVKIEKGTSKRK